MPEHAGQPTKIDDSCVQLLIGAFQNGLDVKAACIYAGISRTAYYERCKTDQKFLDTMERAKNNLTELAGARIQNIIRSGHDRDAGPLAWKIFEKKMPETYGNVVVNNNNQQNNFFLIKNGELNSAIKESGFSSSDPSQLLEDVEDVIRMDTPTEEESSAQIHN